MLRLNQSIGVREKGIRDKHFLVINIRIFLRNGRSFVCSRNIYRNTLLFLTRIKFLIEDMFMIVTMCRLKKIMILFVESIYQFDWDN